MTEEEMLALLRENGYDAEDRDGVATVLFQDAGSCAVELEKIRAIARASGYDKSIGIRAVKEKNGEKNGKK